jgi:hypothetical protein
VTRNECLTLVESLQGWSSWCSFSECVEAFSIESDES